jgi:myo-inositol-1(or 4)-monophosphatase
LIRYQSQNSFAVEHKGPIDLVTSVDRGSQEMIVNAIRTSFPGHAILAEEDFCSARADRYLWIIDPIDGTTNFVHGLPFYCVSIALYRDNLPFIGVCYNPATDELFSAQTEQGARLNGRRITVSATASINDALAVTGFPYKQDNLDEILTRFARVIRSARGVRRLGSAALDLCYVAAGRLDCFWETELNAWDMAAGALIAREAGAVLTGIDGQVFDAFGGTVVAANPRLHPAILELM